MKTLLLLSLLSFTKLPVHYCKIQTINCITGKYDTIYVKTKGNLCLARLEGTDTTFSHLADGSNRIFKDSVCDFKVLYYSDKPF